MTASTHLLEAGCDIRTVLELLKHQNLPTTMVYTCERLFSQR
ncbi:tyrosine-type recombinase/integrase [Microcoleus vaginatus]